MDAYDLIRPFLGLALIAFAVGFLACLAFPSRSQQPEASQAPLTSAAAAPWNPRQPV